MLNTYQHLFMVVWSLALVEVIFLSSFLEDKMIISTVILFYEKGKTGTDTSYREKIHVDLPEEATNWTVKSLK